MPHFVENCPLCRSKSITFDVLAQNALGVQGGADWQIEYQVMSRCRQCRKATLWTLRLKVRDLMDYVKKADFWKSEVSLNDIFQFRGYQSLKDQGGLNPPEHLPEDIISIFNEAATTAAVNCPNASAAMSRLCLDVVTKQLLPAENDANVAQPGRAQRTKLFDRLDWLFERSLLPADLKPLADAIRQHGNDGVHDGTCTSTDAEDLLDFTMAVLERVYTVPERARLANERFRARRSGAGVQD